MRVPQNEVQIAVPAVKKHLGASAAVRLFGSRTDDTRKGGDLDLYVETDAANVALPVARARGELADAEALSGSVLYGECYADIQDAIGLIAEYTRGLTVDSFAAETIDAHKTRDSVIKNLVDIGEAANNVMQLAPEIEQRNPALWRHLRGAYDMRIKLTHGYRSVNDRVVWNTVIDAPCMRGRRAIWRQRSRYMTHLDAEDLPVLANRMPILVESPMRAHAGAVGSCREKLGVARKSA